MRKQGAQDPMIADAAQAQRFLTLALKNRFNLILLERLPCLDLDDIWLVSGCLFQTVWNMLDGRDPNYGIKDYDIFYCDKDLSWEAEDAAIKRANALFADLPIEIELRNQARVHLWYERKFGVSCPAFKSSREGIDNFLNTFSMVGVEPAASGPALYAPCGLEDVFGRIMRPSPLWRGSSRRDRYDEKAARWKNLWPDLKVLPWDYSAPPSGRG